MLAFITKFVQIAYADSPGYVNLGNEDIIDYLARILGKALGYASAIAVGFVIFSGILFIMSNGDPEKLGTAKRALLWSIIGTVVIVGSYTFVVVLNKLFNS